MTFGTVKREIFTRRRARLSNQFALNGWFIVSAKANEDGETATVWLPSGQKQTAVPLSRLEFLND